MSKQETMTTEQFNTAIGKRKAFAPLADKRTLTITIPLPGRTAHPNARAHWRSKAAAKKKQREAAYIAALDAMHDWKEPPRWERATIHATFYRPGSRDRISDPDNLIAWLKGSADGIADAGVIANDRGLTWLAPSQVIGNAANGMCGVILVIEPLKGNQ